MQTTIKIGKNYNITQADLHQLNILKRCNIQAEASFIKESINHGWNVLRSGWPDYLIIKGKSAAFVEVKSEKDKLRKEQIKMLDALAGIGLKCYIWKPKTGFQLYRKSSAR